MPGILFQGGAGSQGAQGAAGSNGAQGAQGAAGSNGAQGAQGAAGSNGSQGAQGAAGSSTPTTNWASPSRYGYVAWSIPPTLGINAGVAMTTGSVIVCKVIAETAAVSATRTVYTRQLAAATTLTLGSVAVFNSSGTQLGSTSADQSANWNASTGNRTATVGTFAVAVGDIMYIAFLCVGTTGVGFSRATNSAGENMDVAAASSLWGVAATGQATMPGSIVPANITAYGVAIHAALK